MDTSWIQVFVLTLTECVAPAGKNVCQQQEVQYQFVDRGECEAVLEQLVALKSEDKNVIVDTEGSRCLPTIKQQTVFASLDAANAQLAGSEGWGKLAPERQQQASDGTLSDYEERLASLPECDDAKSVTPCKKGKIIVESDVDEKVEVWREDDE